MRGNRSRDTAPELALRRLLHGQGLRYRVDAVVEDGLACRADLVFRAARVAVFVDGCFWHRCPLHATVPTANASYWKSKFDRIVARDRRNDVALADAGWTVVRIWEHDPVEIAGDRVCAALAEARRHAARPEPMSARRAPE
jgi:DNA mismatch endonuclease (patch repair protein)